MVFTKGHKNKSGLFCFLNKIEKLFYLKNIYLKYKRSHLRKK